MTLYSAPLDDMRFALYDLLGADARLAQLPGGEAINRELVDAVLTEAARFTEQVLAPLNQSGDAEGCHYDKASASVTTPKGFREAYAQYVDGGWVGLTAPEAFGGQQLPGTIGSAIKEMVDSANLAWGIYSLLSQGAMHALE
jgi:alkylation response protein AidB-like acyl-CoA dehydrogenase